MASAYPYFHDGPAVLPDNRTIDQIYQASLKEGGFVTLWHGGDEPNQQAALKSAFEKKFPGMTLNVTVGLSKYLDINIDEQLARNELYVDVTALQTLQDFPRWKQAGVLQAYKPRDYESVFSEIVDTEGYYMAVRFFHWPISFEMLKVNGSGLVDYNDLLKPEFKDKLVLTYPDDDDAVLHNFNEILKQYGTSWFDKLLAQNPQWVRGTQTPQDIILMSNSTKSATFAAFGAFTNDGPLTSRIPKTGHFTSWPQTGCIFADAPHPESAKLLLNFMISTEWQQILRETGWSIRKDIAPPTGFNQSLLDIQNTDPLGFRDFMMDRAVVERIRFWYEERIGPAQGLDPNVADV